MNILFIAQLVPDNLVNTCSGYSVAGDLMIKNIVKGMELIDNVCIDVLSVMPKAAFPRDVFYEKEYTDVYSKTKVYNVSYCNLPIIKQMMQYLKMKKKALKLAKKKKYDIILCFNMYMQFARTALVLEKLTTAKVVGLLADFPLEDKKTYQGFTRLFFEKVREKTFDNIKHLKHAIVLNENASSFLCDECDYVVMPGGFCKDNNTYEIQPVTDNTIVYAGALTEYSGIKNLIKAVQMIDEFDCSLEIYGSGNLKEYVVDCQKRDKKIKYMGLRERGEMRDRMKSAWILVNPRVIDDPISQVTFPSKIFEYIMCGRPVVATVFRGMPNDIENIVYSCKIGDAEDIKNRIVEIYNMNEAELNCRIRGAWKHMLENYSWEKQCTNMYLYFKNTVLDCI